MTARTRATQADINPTPSDLVHTSSTNDDTAKSDAAQAEKDRDELAELRRFKAEHEQNQTPIGAPAGEDVNKTDSDEKPAHKLFIVVSHLGEGRQHTETVTAESADGLEQKSMHAYGLKADQVHVYEVQTV